MNNFIQQTDKALKKKKKRWTSKGRQVEDKYLADLEKIFKDKVIKRDELIEYLHLIQDNFGVLYDKHLVALAEITKLPSFTKISIELLSNKISNDDTLG